MGGHVRHVANNRWSYSLKILRLDGRAIILRERERERPSGPVCLGLFAFFQGVGTPGEVSLFELHALL